jgi:diguanylate cyclase (GGDEF)-like protein
MSRQNSTNILLIEDNPGDAHLVEIMLTQPEKSCFQLHIADSLSAAYKKLQEHNFHVALLDMSLPDGEGLDNISSLRAVSPDLPIVVLSGRRDEFFALEAVKAGAQDYLVKGEVDEWQLSRALNYAIERKQLQDDILFMAHHDQLTGLANRTLFQSRLEHAMHNATRRDEYLAVLYLDMDHFKPVNDALGHDIGDQLLINIARRLESFVREIDTVARLGGDEFAIVLEGVNSIEDVATVSKKIISGLADPFDIDEHNLHISSSIGAAIYPQHGNDIATLVKNADAAMYKAKHSGRNKYVLYKENFGHLAKEKLNLNNELRQAVYDEQFVLHYQPKFDVSSGTITGSEALIRWQHPQQGLIYPTKFIPLLEKNGMISTVGKWVLKSACAQHAKWHEKGLPVGKIAVNLSGQQLLQRNFNNVVKEILDETGLSPSMLEVELTESLLIKNTDLTMSILDSLKSTGVSIAIDDFGTGYSSFDYLKHYLVDTLKIDRSFIMDVAYKPREAVITSAIIKLAQDLGIHVIAEGVENVEQLNYLKAHNIDEIQGYYFSPPVHAEEISNLIDAQKNAA